MAEQQTSGRLAMVSVPVLPQREAPIAPSPRVSTFGATRLIQKSGIILLALVLCLTAYFAISRYFFKSVTVVGVSMVPTLQENGEYLLNLWAFHNREPHRNDIVVLRDPMDHGLSVKRIIAVSGESVHFKDGKVFVNGHELDEPYLLPNTHTFTYSQAKEQFITCGQDQYFVLGDNRPRSIDSRAYGTVSRQDILGAVKLP